MDAMRHPKTPAFILVRSSARQAVTDGVPVALGVARAAKHRLVTIGDSVTDRFQSFAIHGQRPLPRKDHRGGVGCDYFRHTQYPASAGFALNFLMALCYRPSRSVSATHAVPTRLHAQAQTQSSSCGESSRSARAPRRTAARDAARSSSRANDHGLFTRRASRTTRIPGARTSTSPLRGLCTGYD